MFYGARWYDAYLNRWIQPDPIISNPYYSTDWDRYSYVRNNPTNYIDPTGNKPCDGNNTSPDQCNGITQDDLLKVLKIVYRWKVIGNWTKNELYKLIDTGNDIEKYTSTLTNGNGKGWMYSNMGNVQFIHSSTTDKILAKMSTMDRPIGGMTPISYPYIILAQNGIDNYIIAHELAHVWDNSAGTGTCASTWCGGGPADELTVYTGGNPSGVRWRNGTSGIPKNYQWQITANWAYGNNSTADYFAESFAWMIYNPGYLPQPGVLYWMQSLISQEGR